VRDIILKQTNNDALEALNNCISKESTSVSTTYLVEGLSYDGLKVVALIFFQQSVHTIEQVLV